MNFGRSHPVRQSNMTSIFFLTSIFNHSIHSSIAVFYLGPHIHEKWKGRIETWQPRKRQKRRPRRNNWSFTSTSGGAQASPLVFSARPLPVEMICYKGYRTTISGEAGLHAEPRALGACESAGRKCTLAVWSAATKTKAARPACAPSRERQEQKVILRGEYTVAVWSGATSNDGFNPTPCSLPRN